MFLRGTPAILLLQAAESSTFHLSEVGKTWMSDVRVTALERQSIFLPPVPGTQQKRNPKQFCRTVLT